jgi:hypothetical protein
MPTSKLLSLRKVSEASNQFSPLGRNLTPTGELRPKRDEGVNVHPPMNQRSTHGPSSPLWIKVLPRAQVHL